MYRRPKFLELLLEIREDMAREAEYDIGQFVQDLRRETVDGRSGKLRNTAPLNGSEITKASKVRRP